MNQELLRARNRQMVIFLLVCLGMVVMLGRLYYWQIVEAYSGYDLAQRANDEHIQSQVVTAPRGLIYDAHGQLLATNVVRDDVYIEPIQFSVDHPDTDTFQSDLNALVSSLHQALPQLTQGALTKDFNSGLATVRIAEAIDPAQSQELRNMRLPDIFLEPRTVRVYPGDDLAAQILGFVQGGNGMGTYGVEQQYNALLAGKAGSLTAETDLNGNPLTVGASSSQPVVNGANLTLTIDSTMQYFVQTNLADAVQQMGAQSGTALVVNARTGAIVAMAGAPSFDPNHYGDYANLKGCLNSEDVYFDPALYCTYEPGSTMKAVTMAAALDQGVITPDTSLNDPGYIDFPDAPVVTNWDDLGYGQETMTQVLEHSANVGAAWVAYNKLGPERYYPYLARFGFGQPTGVGGADEASGGYRTSTSPGWTPSDLTRQSFGQSITATPLQVAMAYQAIANGGNLMKSYLLASVNDNGRVTTTRPQVQRRVISQRAAQQLTSMLVQSATVGMAKVVSLPGYSVAAKTGTATTQGIAATETEASVAGFLPASNPQFVILVKLDRPQATIYGGTAAAPLWKAIAQQLMWYYDVPPDQQ
ncbi:MAG TPA: penicillin-binding protein 2 [Ktedonobacteraceae bacterium]